MPDPRLPDPAPTLASARLRQAGVEAPGRLHLGFLDPAGTLGRRFGSLGLVIEGFATRVNIAAASHDAVTAASSQAAREIDRVTSHLRALRHHTGLDAPLAIELVEALPSHAGFGSGTQLALAVGRAFALWHGLDVPTVQLARWLDRGLRSGVGIAGFDAGGLLLDAGPGPQAASAPLLSRLAFPEAWRIVLVLDSRGDGLHGVDEKQALARLPELPRPVAAEICHEVVMRVLAGAAAHDFPAFAAGLTHVQRLLGAHFAAAQGGRPFTSAAVEQVLDRIAMQVEAAIGQSSWGPTGFAVLASEAEAQAVVAHVRRDATLDPALALHIVAGRNRGATLTRS